MQKNEPIALNWRRKTSHCKSRAFASKMPTKNNWLYKTWWRKKITGGLTKNFEKMKGWQQKTMFAHYK